ncbi:MAG: glycosyl transferase [Chitinophagaceae bacterium]|nr:glycosyl transferase [Chitinophagaceae bacterium]
MKIAFTLCSNNYLAQAKTLGDSLILHNPEYRLIIGLVDKKSSQIDYAFFEPHSIIPIEEIGIPNFEQVTRRYNIVELNTCVKPSFFKYLSKRFPDVPFIFYFDPDIVLFNRVTALEQEFQQADILVTPHITTPISLDEFWPGEHTFLNYGIYNLGFIGVKVSSSNSMSMLNWWEERTLTRGFSDVERGFFVDQLWITLAPVFFPGVKVIKGLGYNAAPWNLHERRNIKLVNGQYSMEDNSLLYFYHFSGYNFKRPEAISKWYNRYSFDNCPNLKPLYEDYDKLLRQNRVDYFSSITCFYWGPKVHSNRKRKLRRLSSNIIKKITKYAIGPF